MYLISLFFLAIFFLIGVFLLTAQTTAFRRLHKRESQKQFENVSGFRWVSWLHRIFFAKNEFEAIFFTSLCALNVARFCYPLFGYMFLSNTKLFQEATEGHDLSFFWMLMALFALVLVGFIMGDFLPRIFGAKKPEAAIRMAAPLSSLYMLLAFPLSLLFLKVSQSFAGSINFDPFQEPSTQAKQEIIEIIQNTELTSGISFHDRQLIESVLNFRDRVVREVMVPRINVFGLAAELSIKDAAQQLYEEGYSRIPIYKGNLDNIVGILMYKDLLQEYKKYEEQGNASKILEAPVESIVKPAMYTPETKKISNLLQEFRKRQVHLAIVVDEYGGTEGLVTIEDILEAIVGDIADEYDQEEQLFKEASDHSYLVDAKMNIIDAEEQLGISFPEEGDYDTIGGYIYHCTGAIPSKGFTIHHDTFDLEVISSNERSIEKVRIKPREV